MEFQSEIYVRSRELEWEGITRDSTVVKKETMWWTRTPGCPIIQIISLRRYRGKLLLYNLLVRRQLGCYLVILLIKEVH